MNLNVFQRKAPARADLPDLAAGDYRAAAQRCEVLQREISEWRAKPPALKDAMRILERHAAQRRGEFETVIDERLAVLVNPDFNEEASGLLDLTRFLAPGNMGAFVFDESMWGLMSDRLLEVAEIRLKSLGFGKGPSIEEKRKKLAELQAEHEATAAVRDDSLALWRKLTGKLGGFPA